MKREDRYRKAIVAASNALAQLMTEFEHPDGVIPRRLQRIQTDLLLACVEPDTEPARTKAVLKHMAG